MRAFFVLLITFAFSHVAFADDGLPRVLILGDSVYRQPASDAAKQLKDKVEVVYAAMQPGEVRNTTYAIDNLDALLGEEKWDLIHFNFGLGDLVHRAPGMKAFRVMAQPAGGVRATSPQQYERNLQALVKRFQATGARVVWASTTPIRHSASHVFQLGSEIEYNAIAAGVMAAHQVPTNDMYTYVKNLIDMKKPASHGADPFFFDRQPLHEPIVNTILSELSLD